MWIIINSKDEIFTSYKLADAPTNERAIYIPECLLAGLSTGGTEPPPSHHSACCPITPVRSIHSSLPWLEGQAPCGRAVLTDYYWPTDLSGFSAQLHTTEFSSTTFENKEISYVSEKHSKRDGSELEGWEKMTKTTRNLCQFRKPWAVFKGDKTEQFFYILYLTISFGG